MLYFAVGWNVAGGFRPTHRIPRTVLLVRLLEDSLVLEKFLDLGEQGLLLVIVVRLDEFEPCQAIAYEVRLFRLGNVRGLEED